MGDEYDASSNMKLSLVVALGLLATIIAGASARGSEAEQKSSARSTRIIFLGTNGGPDAAKFRSEPATLLVVNGTPYLIDVGPGTDRQLAWAGFKHSDIRAVFITHHHVDHDGGLVPFISLTWFDKAWNHRPPSSIDIYGPPGTIYLMHSALDFLSVSERIFRAGAPALAGSDGMFDAHDIEQDGPFFSDGSVSVSAAQNSHYYFTSRGPTGDVDKSYAYRFNTPAGAVAFTGDTGPSDAVVKLAQGADVLVSEVCVCTRNSPTRNSASDAAIVRPPDGLADQELFHMQHEHLTPEEVGRIATRAHVRTVILTHFVGGGDDPKDLSKFTSDVRRTSRDRSLPPKIFWNSTFHRER